MTGGGPAPKKPTSSVEKIVNMMQDTASFAGIEGGLHILLWRCQFIPFKVASEKTPKQIINNVNIDKSVSICSI